MAYADWTFEQNAGGTNSAQLYSGGFPAPTASAGNYARALNTVGGNNAYAAFYPSNPVFTGVPSTKAIRVQAMVRVNFPPTGYMQIALFAKSALNSNLSGYGLIRAGNSIIFQAGNLNAGGATTLENALSDTWVNLRMSVYSIGVNVDRIICEKETSIGSNVWTSTFGLASGDITVDGNLTPSRYMPWGGTRKNGIGSFVHPSSFQPPNGGYIDMLSVSLADV